MIQDVVTRWGSCHDMLERVVYLRKAVDAFVKDLRFSELEISASEWTQVEFVFNILIPVECNGRKDQEYNEGYMYILLVYGGEVKM